MARGTRELHRALIGFAIALLACSKNDLGESCSSDDSCKAGYVCFRGTCNTAKAREQALNTQSGVGSAPIERPVVGGDRVRVRVTHGEPPIFAACAATERLVGGGCHGGDNCASESSCSYIRSYPGNFTADDTLGARWICNGASGRLQAYALCQETAPSTVTAPKDPPPVDAGLTD